MKCKVFCDRNVFRTVDSFNEWAKGKALTREVIIHTLYVPATQTLTDTLCIVVYHPEDKYWDATPRQLTAPIHETPEPHIKQAEIQVT
jgi:hypothetical protein